MEKKYKVFYQGSLYGHFGRDRAGKEIEINKSFLWGGESRLVPSVYVCGKGLVADILKSVSVEDFRAFAEKFGLDEADDPENFRRSVWRKQRRKIRSAAEFMSRRR